MRVVRQTQQMMCDTKMPVALALTGLTGTTLSMDGAIDAPDILPAGGCEAREISPHNFYGYRYAAQIYVWRGNK